MSYGHRVGRAYQCIVPSGISLHTVVQLDEEGAYSSSLSSMHRTVRSWVCTSFPTVVQLDEEACEEGAVCTNGSDHYEAAVRDDGMEDSPSCWRDARAMVGVGHTRSPHPEHDVAVRVSVSGSGAVRAVRVAQLDVPPSPCVRSVHATAAVGPIAGTPMGAVVVAAWIDAGEAG